MTRKIFVPADINGHPLRNRVPHAYDTNDVSSQAYTNVWPVPALTTAGDVLSGFDVIILYLLCVIAICLSFEHAPNQWWTFGVIVAVCILLPFSIWLHDYTEEHPWWATTTSLIALTVFGVILYFVMMFIYNTEVNISNDVEESETTFQKWEDSAIDEFNKVKSVFSTIARPFVWVWDEVKKI